jgi:hypothetical protein
MNASVAACNNVGINRDPDVAAMMCAMNEGRLWIGEVCFVAILEGAE